MLLITNILLVCSDIILCLARLVYYTFRINSYLCYYFCGGVNSEEHVRMTHDIPEHWFSMNNIDLLLTYCEGIWLWPLQCPVGLLFLTTALKGICYWPLPCGSFVTDLFPVGLLLLTSALWGHCYWPLPCGTCCWARLWASRQLLTFLFRFSLQFCITRSTMWCKLPRLWKTCRDVATWVGF